MNMTCTTVHSFKEKKKVPVLWCQKMYKNYSDQFQFSFIYWFLRPFQNKHGMVQKNQSLKTIRINCWP
jgi:hypothetical protein